MASKMRSSKDDSRSINKSNTQASSFRKSTQETGKVKNCVFYKDGDHKVRPVTLVINPRRVFRLESIITELSSKMRGLPFGVRSIFTPRGNDMITSLDGLEHGQSYVCSSKRHQARGIDPSKVQPPPRWYYDKPSSGSREYNTLLQEYTFEDRARFVGRRYLPRDQRMADAYNRNQPKKITVLKNGDPTVRHVVLINRRTAQSFEQILSDISNMFRLAIRKLFTVEGKRVSSLTSMINGPDVLVAAGKEPFKTMVGFVFEPEPPNASPSRIRSRMGTQNDDVAGRLKRRRDRMMRTRGTWKVWCTTSELSRAGTSAQVTITVYGHKGNSGPIPLGYPDGLNFQPGRVDEFDINVGLNIGEIYKIRIAHDNTGESPGWFCDEVRMKDVDTDETLTFPYRRWLARDEDDHDTCREMPTIRRGEPHLPLIKYDVTVATGDLWNGGTHSNVYLTIYGERGDTGIRQLYVENKDQAFNKGQINHFTLEAVSLGHLKKVIVGHDGTVPGEGWYLEKLSIQEPDAKPHEVYHFYCGRWLDEGEDDGKIVRELKVQDEYMEDILEKRNWEYEKWKFENKNQVTFISMLSGKALRIKTDGTVDGLGEESDSASSFIVSSKKPMIRIFTSLLNSNFHLAIDHGKVTGQGRGGPQCEFRIHVQPDRSVMLEGAKSPLQFVTLQESGKLGDSRTVMDKDPAKRFHVYVKGVLRHRGVVMLRTSNIQAISVDHDKSVYATGRCNRAAHFRVHKVDSGGVRMFESMIYPGFYLRLKDGKFDCNGSRNEDSQFLVQKHKDKGYFTFQLNQQRGMFVGFTPRGDVRPTIDTGINNIHIFPEIVEAGMSKQKMIEDKLTPISERDGLDETPRSYRSPDVKKKAKPEFEEGDFHVLVSSAENLENGKVALLVFGDQGNTGPIMLNGPPDNGPLFRGGNTDEFKINLAKVGNPFKIRLELIPKNQNKVFSWKVERLILTDMLTQDKLTFPFSRWMSRNKDDEEIMRELPVIRPGHESEALPVVKYIVTVFTGKDPGSETDADVFINVFGDYGDTGKRQLRISNRPKLFQKGQADQFEVEAVHLGCLNKISIGHDETRPGEGWFLEKVVIREGKTANMQFVFPCSRWLDSGMEDRKLERVLAVQEPAPSRITPVRELSNHPVLPPIGSPISKTSDNTEQFEEEERKIMEMDVTEEEAEASDAIVSDNSPELLESTAEETADERNEVIAEDQTELETEIEYEEEDEIEETIVEAIDEEKENEDKIEELKNVNAMKDKQGEEAEFSDQETLPFEEPKKEEEKEANASIQLITHRDSGAKMEDTVILYIYGYEGKVGPLLLGSGKDGLFQPGAEDQMKIHIEPELGQWYKLRVGLVEEVEGADWHLDRLILTDTTYGNQMEFDVDRWMSRRRDDFDTWRELPVIRHDEPPLPVIHYTIEVHTGDISGADTDAAVFINLIGQRGDTGKRRLYMTQKEGKMFSQGKIDSFILEAVSLGDIQSVIIGHEEKTPGSGWYLSYVSVKELNSNDQQVETYFPCDRWFDISQDDGLTERELLPVQKSQAKSESSGEYHMWVNTAEDSEPTSGGKAILVVYGEKGKSEDIKLFAPNSTAKLFDSGNSDEFEVATGDIGQIYKIRVTKEDDPNWKTWHLEEVKMEDKVTGETFVFAFDRWFSRDMEDGDLSRELPVIISGKELLPVKCYEIQVTTGDHWAAETDVNIFVTLFGSQGDSGRRLLHKSKSGRKAFVRGQDDVFTIEAVDLKEIEKVGIEHDGKGAGSGWFLDCILVKEVGRSSSDPISFPCYKWLDEGEEDGKTSRILRNTRMPHVPHAQKNVMPDSCEGAWKVKVKTSELDGADTHAQIYLTVYGTKDSSHPIPLGDGSPTQDFFSEGKESTFDVKLDEIGSIRKIRLEHDNANKNPSWHLDWVHMVHVDSGFECLFSFDCWLSEDQKDGQVFRERAVEIPGCMPSPVLHYMILVQTGRAKDSGAHGGLCTVNLIGSQGETGQQLLLHPLSNVNDCLREGITDVYVMEAVSVGELKSIRLGFEGRGRAKQWFVENVKVMESLLSQAEFVFKANKWLNDDDNSAVTLPLSDKVVASSLPAGIDYSLLGHHFPQSKGSWDLWIWTGQQDGAGTNENVNLWLYGTTGHSNPVLINKDGALNAGSVLRTQIHSSNLGEIFKIRLAFAEKTGNSSWYLDKIKLKDSDSNQEFNFDFHNWIQSTDDNVDGTVELPAIRPDITPLHEISYMVSVKTGDLPCAETAADVTLMLIGQWGDSGQKSLAKSKNNRDPFHRGQTDDFEFRLLDLGSISKILIGHTEHGRGVGWFCQQVAITSVSVNGEKTETIFTCNRWLDTGVDDRKTLREFSAIGSIDPEDLRPGVNSRGPWTCHVVMATEDQLDASLTPRYSINQVSLVVYGTQGVTGPIELGEGAAGKFALGTTEVFKGLNFGDLGDLKKIRVSSGLEEEDKTMWTIDKIMLKDEKTRECFHFQFDDVGKVGGDIRKERPVLRPGTEIPAMIKYKLWVETEDSQGAGTSANVYATIYGSMGDSGRRILRTTDGIKPFQQGQTQPFEIEAVDLGDLEKLVLMKGPGDPWLLNQVVIKAGIFGPVENVFIWSNWIGENERRNNEVEVTLPLISTKPSSVAVPADQFPDFPLTRGVWNIETLTSDKGTKGSVDDVIVVFVGSKGESSPVRLKGPNSFQPGRTDNFEIHLAEDVGEIIKMRLGFEDNSYHKAWHVKKMRFEDKETQDTFWFAFNDAVQVDDVTDGWTEFPVVWPGVFILPVVEYTITVETGDVDDASTLAQILIRIEGQMGGTGYRILKDTRSEKPKFQQAQTDTFVIKAVSLLSIYSVTIGHIDQNIGAGWFLNKVKLRPSNEEEDYVFNCNRWLDKGKDDGETMRTLYLSDDDDTATVGATDEAATARTQDEPVTEPAPEDGVTYDVTTVTGNGVGHGTNAPAILVLYGEKGNTGPLLIGGGENGFKEGETQHFNVHTNEEIGDLFKIRVGFNSEGHDQEWYADLYQCPSWCPNMIKIADKRTGKEFVFEMRQWVRMEEDHDYWKEFPVRKENMSQMLVVRDYFLDVHTGSKFGSGTDANVYVQIHGENGDTGWRHLHGSRTNMNKFETAQHDLFRVEAVDLGQLSKVIVKHDGYGPGSGWYLDHITVKESEDASETYLFECDKWLDEGEDDQALERELPLTRIISETGNKEEPKLEEQKEPKAGDWRVFTVTNPEGGSGTDANVILTVIGDKGDSGPLPLASKEEDCFKEGQTDQFDIWLEPSDIGDIKKIRLEQDNSGDHSSWRVDKVIMENLFTNAKLTFDVDRWLSADHKNGDTVYEGAALYSDKPKAEVFKYVVKTVTEEKPESGTDANVYINIIGTNGDSGKRWLRHELDNRKKFDDGMTNLFLVEAVDLGDLEKVVIGHDQSGRGSAWKLQCVMIRKSLSDNQTIVFPWGKWIPDADGGNQEVTILASSESVDEVELEENQDSVHPLPINEVGGDEDLVLNLPESDRTEINNTYRTDEGIQEDFGIDSTYRTDDGVLPPDTMADTETDRNETTARMYTASDSTAIPYTNDQTYRESALNNENNNDEAPQDNAAPTDREGEVNEEKINQNPESKSLHKDENGLAASENVTERKANSPLPKTSQNEEKTNNDEIVDEINEFNRSEDKEELSSNVEEIDKVNQLKEKPEGDIVEDPNDAKKSQAITDTDHLQNSSENNQRNENSTGITEQSNTNQGAENNASTSDPEAENKNMKNLHEEKDTEPADNQS